MASTLHLHQSSPSNIERVHSKIRSAASSLAADHSLALVASAKAATPRKSLAALRAMYAAPLDARVKAASEK